MGEGEVGKSGLAEFRVFVVVCLFFCLRPVLLLRVTQIQAKSDSESLNLTRVVISPLLHSHWGGHHQHRREILIIQIERGPKDFRDLPYEIPAARQGFSLEHTEPVQPGRRGLLRLCVLGRQGSKNCY